jgi:hypothetical protein
MRSTFLLSCAKRHPQSLEGSFIAAIDFQAHSSTRKPPLGEHLTINPEQHNGNRSFSHAGNPGYALA